MRLIDADPFKAKLLSFMNIKAPTPSDTDCILDGVLNLLEEQPTIDPLKHGRWIICREFDHKLKCSQCGCHTVWMDEVVPNYCPYCGARMIELKK